MAAIRAAAPIFKARDSDLFNFSFSLDLDVHSSLLCFEPDWAPLKSNREGAI